MKNTELMGFFVKIISVYVLIISINGLSSNVVGFTQLSEKTVEFMKWHFYITSAVCVAGVFIAVVMWKFPITISKWFLPRCSDENYPEIDLRASSLEIIGFSIIGIFILSQSIPLLAQQVGNLLIYSSNEGVADPTLITRIKLSIGTYGLQVLIGIFLCVFSGSLKLLLVSIRNKIVEMGSR